MYQSPQALDLNASYYQHEALNAAEQRRLLHSDDDTHTSSWLSAMTHRVNHFEVRLMAVALALVALVGAVALF